MCHLLIIILIFYKKGQQIKLVKFYFLWVLGPPRLAPHPLPSTCAAFVSCRWPLSLQFLVHCRRFLSVADVLAIAPPPSPRLLSPPLSLVCGRAPRGRHRHLLSACVDDNSCLKWSSLLLVNLNHSLPTHCNWPLLVLPPTKTS